MPRDSSVLSPAPAERRVSQIEMPRRRRAARASIQNLSKAKKKKDNYDDVLTMSNKEDDEDSEGSSVEILDGGSSADIYKETELTKFSKMLFDAQKRALAEEKAKSNKRKTYNGHSRTTAHRRKRYQSDLAARGFLPVHEFMKRVEAQKNKEGLSTASQQLPYEESEESSGSDDGVAVLTVSAPVSRLWNNNEPEPSTSEGMGSIRELAPAASEERLGAAQGVPEEEEESTGSEGEGGGTTTHVDDSLRRGVTSNKYNTHIGIGAALFEDLRRRVLMKSAGSFRVSRLPDGTLTFL